MKHKVQEREPIYLGPVAVTVSVDQWSLFDRHAPAWWPKQFKAPSPDLLHRVDRGLRKQLL